MEPLNVMRLFSGGNTGIIMPDLGIPGLNAETASDIHMRRSGIQNILMLIIQKVYANDFEGFQVQVRALVACYNTYCNIQIPEPTQDELNALYGHFV